MHFEKDDLKNGLPSQLLHFLLQTNVLPSFQMLLFAVDIGSFAAEKLLHILQTAINVMKTCIALVL